MEKTQELILENQEKMKEQMRSLGLDILANLPNQTPRLFIVLPEALFDPKPKKVEFWKFGAKVKDLFQSKWRVLLLCEGNEDKPCHINSHHEGYPITINKAWLQKALPMVKIGLKVVSIVVQMGSYGAINLGPLCSLLPSNLGTEGLNERLESVSEGLDNAAGSVDQRYQTTKNQMINDALNDENLLRDSQDTLVQMLQAYSDQTGNLTQCYNNKNQIVWVCEDCKEGMTTINKKEHQQHDGLLQVTDEHKQSIMDSKKSEFRLKREAKKREKAAAKEQLEQEKALEADNDFNGLTPSTPGTPAPGTLATPTLASVETPRKKSDDEPSKSVSRGGTFKLKGKNVLGRFRRKNRGS